MKTLILGVGLGVAATAPISTFIARPSKANHVQKFRFQHRTAIVTNHVQARPRRRFNDVQTSLPSSPLSSHFAAGGMLLSSTLIGALFELICKSSGGHVVTLLSAAILSNFSQVLPKGLRIPTEHFLYDWCWSIFLPASLVFALLSSSSSDILAAEDATQSTASAVTKNCIQSMALPFIIGSIGSILGCMISFFAVPMTCKTTSAILAGCLCSSYIGGTVNFFAAGRILTPLSKSNDLSNAFGSMAAADLVVMALYFTMLSAASRSSWLKKLFPSKVVDLSNKGGTPIAELNTTEPTNYTHNDLLDKVGAASIAIVMALSSVFVSSHMEKTINNQFGIPGTQCAFLAVCGLLYDKLIMYGTHAPKQRQTTSLTHGVRAAVEQIHTVAPSLGNLSFFLLFAAVGSTADVSSAITGGPMALVFATLALTVHSTVLLSSTLLVSKLIKSMQKLGYTWPCSSSEEILTASNAAIGGPSTAGAFASSLVGLGDGASYRRALVIAATFYGVLGYAVGTSLGVVLSKSLLRWITS
ncbi:hypothetical protein ACHAWO_010501 [Cyclotella atomus]|uniref:Uncharacterized protein n=1 Tax=Cyclotella atomus TaxID=382360 RepID=A0ABD3Q9F0_9STRA